MEKLSHPNIVGFKESFFTKGKSQVCIVLTYCDGGDLSERIQEAKGKPFKEDQIMHWFVQIGLAMEYLHQQKILHRDVKTQNIFLLGNGRLVLGDLGISKVLDGTMAMASTQIGTPFYMSPELFKNQRYNHKSDVWALGCVLYELTALKHPFNANSLSALSNKIMRGSYPPINRKYSDSLRKLISSMLSLNPSGRPSVADILKQPFVKKHLCNFIRDATERAKTDGKIGEGTMVLRSVAEQLMEENSSQNPLGPNGKSLIKQLEKLGLTSVITSALPSDQSSKWNQGSDGKDDRRSVAASSEAETESSQQPAGSNNSKEGLREQKSALNREQERRKAVQLALARLRREREARSNRHRSPKSDYGDDYAKPNGSNNRRAPAPSIPKQKQRQDNGQPDSYDRVAQARAKKESLQRQRQRDYKAWEAKRGNRAHAKHLRNLPAESKSNDSRRNDGVESDKQTVQSRPPPGLPPKNPTPIISRDGSANDVIDGVRGQRIGSSDSGDDDHPSSSRSQPDRTSDRVRVVDEEQHRMLFGRSNSAENKQAAHRGERNFEVEPSKINYENLSARERVLAAKEARQRERQAQHEQLLKHAREAQRKDKSFAAAMRREQYSGMGVAISGGLPIHRHVMSSALNDNVEESKESRLEKSDEDANGQYVLPAARYERGSAYEVHSGTSDEGDIADDENEAFFRPDDDVADDEQDDLAVEDMDDDYSDDEDDFDDEEDEKLHIPKAQDPSEVDQGLQNVEEGLLHELQRSTLRCQQLQADIQNAKSHMQPQDSKYSSNGAHGESKVSGANAREPVAVNLGKQSSRDAYVSPESYYEVLVESDTESTSDDSGHHELDTVNESPYRGVSASVGVDMVFGDHENRREDLNHPGINADQHIATGSLEQRAKALRDACIQDLGMELYEELHAFLKEVMWDYASSSVYSKEFLEEKQCYLEKHPRTHNLLTQLLHIEEAVGM